MQTSTQICVYGTTSGLVHSHDQFFFVSFFPDCWFRVGARWIWGRNDVRRHSVCSLVLFSGNELAGRKCCCLGFIFKIIKDALDALAGIQTLFTKFYFFPHVAEATAAVIRAWPFPLHSGAAPYAVPSYSDPSFKLCVCVTCFIDCLAMSLLQALPCPWTSSGCQLRQQRFVHVLLDCLWARCAQGRLKAHRFFGASLWVGGVWGVNRHGTWFSDFFQNYHQCWVRWK